MLKILRKKGVSKIILWVLAVIIILAFGVFGSVYRMESSADKKLKYAGKIFGEKVPFADFQNQYEQTIISDKLNFGNNFAKIKFQLDQDRVERTWVRIMLLKEAEKRNIKISDDELVKAIAAFPNFQTSDKFNDVYYQNILKNFLNITPRNFEECFRDKLKLDKVIVQETATISVSEEETKKAYRQYNEKVQVSYLLFANDSFRSQIVAEENKIQKFYEDHKTDFAAPPMVNVEFLRFDFPAPMSQAEKGKEAPAVSEEDKDAAWHTAYDARQELKADPDFSVVAAKNKIKVEESGFFSMEQPNLKAGWPFELIQKIFEMKAGDISDPVETARGYQILRIKETKDASMPLLSEVKDKVTDQWKSMEASKLAKAKADEVLLKIRELSEKNPNFDLMKTAKDMGGELVQTPLFGRAESYLPKLGPAPDFMEKAFDLTKDKPLSSVAETSKGYCILRLDNRSEADMTNFEKEKQKFANAILMEKKTKAFNDFLAHLRLKSNLESFIPESKKALK